MYYDISDVKAAGGFSLNFRFSDGLSGTVRFLPSFFWGVFADLKDLATFRQVTLVDGVVPWPGELDLAPDAMLHAIKSQGEQVRD